MPVKFLVFDCNTFEYARDARADNGRLVTRWTADPEKARRFPAELAQQIVRSVELAQIGANVQILERRLPA